MKNVIKEFCKRGLLFAWSGPFIYAIVIYCLMITGVCSSLSVNSVIIAIISTTVLAFVAAGISVVNQIEKLPKPMAALIQMAVLYIDYMGIYLLNGWLNIQKLIIFTIIFVVGFLVIWLSIYLGIYFQVKKLNKMKNKL